jgi:hypothetical protein
MDRFSDPELTAAYGGGVSEYYKNRAGALGESEEVDEGLGSKLFSEYMDRLPDKYRNHGDKDADKEIDMVLSKKKVTMSGSSILQQLNFQLIIKERKFLISLTT